MLKYLEAIADSLLEMPADTLLAGVFLALLLAMPMAGAYLVCRRKSKDATTVLVALAMAGNVAGMAATSGTIWIQSGMTSPDSEDRPPGDPGPRAALPSPDSYYRDHRPGPSRAPRPGSPADPGARPVGYPAPDALAGVDAGRDGAASSGEDEPSAGPTH